MEELVVGMVEEQQALVAFVGFVEGEKACPVAVVAMI